MIELRELRGVPLREALRVLVDARTIRQVAEVQEAVAILHIVENYHRDLPENPMPGRGHLVELAAEGGPKLNEFVPLELSAALGVSQQSITLLITDLLNLEYRHPLLWQQVRAGHIPLWRARKIAERVATVGLGHHAALELDRQLTPTLGGLTVGRSLKLLEGLIVAADPRAAEQRAESQRRSRWVRIQPTADGVSWLDGKLTGADGQQLDATLNRIAAVLKANGDLDNRDARRSSALGVLSNPALALALLQQNQRRSAQLRRDAAAGITSPDAPDDDEPSAGATDLTAGVPASLLDELATIDLKKLVPASTLFVHVSDRAVRKGHGVARVDGFGPVPVTELCNLLKGTQVRVQPVFDPGTVPPVDSYEIPAPMRQAVLLRQPTDVFPFGSSPSRGLDLDHTDPYRHDTGERGQTRVDNLGPLTQRQHRGKTHAGWQVKQVIPGCFLWCSPLGLAYLRTADGLTYALNRKGPPTASGHLDQTPLSA